MAKQVKLYLCRGNGGHPIILLSSPMFRHFCLTGYKSRRSQWQTGESLTSIGTLHLIVTDIRRTYFSRPSSLIQVAEVQGEAPNIVPHEVRLASTLLIGVLSRPQNGT